MDEFHFYADPDRGWAWQVPLLELPQAQFLLMSATLGDVDRLRGRPHPAHRAADRGRHAARAPRAAALRVLLDAGARDHRGAARDRPGARLHRALHPGAALERAQALTSINVATREEKRRHRRADRRLPLLPGVRQDALAARPARRSACTTPGCCRSTAGWSRRWPRPGCSRSSAAPTPSASASTSRSARCCSPALSKYDGSATAAAPGARVPPDRRAGGPGRVRHRGHVVVRRPSTRSRTQAARQGRRRPEEAAQDRAQEAAGGLRVLGRGDVRRLVAAEPEPLDVAHAVSARDADQRDRPRPATPCAADAAPAARQPRDRGRAAPAHPAAAIAHLPARCWPAGVVERLDRARRRRPDASG